jgi:hypothetical protein
MIIRDLVDISLLSVLSTENVSLERLLTEKQKKLKLIELNNFKFRKL